MTPDLTDNNLRDLIAQGLSQREIARRTGMPRATLQDRLKRLGLQVTPPVQKPVSRPDTGAVQPIDTGVVSGVGTGAVQVLDTGAVQVLDTGAVQRLDVLEQEVQGLRLLMQSVLDRLDRPAVSTPVQITTLPTWPKGEAVRWNLWLPKSIRDELSAWATERGIPPSQLVTELLWKALNDRSPQEN
jgi:hypothetical protein